MIDTIILDLDGPVLGNIYRHYSCYSDILTKAGYNPLSIEEYWCIKRSKVNRHIILQASHAEDIYEGFLSSWKDRIETKEYLMLDYLQYGVTRVLRYLKDEGIGVVLATMRNNRDNLLWQLQVLNIQDFFKDLVVVGYGDSSDKSNAVLPYISSNTLWIGDTELDIQAANNIGIEICALTCGLRTREVLESYNPDYIDSSLTSFIRPSRDGRFHDGLCYKGGVLLEA